MRSLLEKTIEKFLKKKKLKFEYERLRIPYKIEKEYVTDFVLQKFDGTPMIIEVKGWFKPSDRTKMKLVKQQNPHLDIRFIFQQDNYLTKKKGKRYSDWAKSNNFPYYVGEDLPKEWIKECHKN